MNRNVKRMQIVKYELHGSLCNEEHILMSDKKLYLKFRIQKSPNRNARAFLLRCCHLEYGVPTGIRTPVTAVKGRCPRPLDDRDSTEDKF